jgi:hypothetical protein
MPPPPQMRVATSGKFAVSQDYGASTATAGLVLTSQGPDNPPDWAVTATTTIRVNAVIFVDATAPLAGQAGTLDHPYRTIQQAIDDAVANYNPAAIIRIAPGGYLQALNIPDAAIETIVFEGWGKEHPLSTLGLPTILGTMTVAPRTGAPYVICLANVRYDGDIVTTNTGTDDVTVKLHGVNFLNGSIAANNLSVYLEHTEFGGGVTINGNATMYLDSDGYSWGEIVRANTTLLPVDYVRTFYEEACDYYDSTLQVVGLAIGASTPVDLPHPRTRPGEVGAVSKIDVAPATDFQMVFSHTSADTATYILTNLSRDSGGGVGNFSADVRSVVWHMAMATNQPA